MDQPLALIVEDDVDASIIFSEALGAAGYRIRRALDGDAAMTQLEETTPHVVVLDLHLPGISGEDILAHLRATDRFAGTQVIVATADPNLGEPLRERADLVLIKPISFVQLRDLAARLR